MDKARRQTGLQNINTYRLERISARARDLVIRHWQRVQRQAGRPLSAIEILPINPKMIAIEGLGLSFDEPEEIGFVEFGGRLKVQIAGMIERPLKKITVVRRLKQEVWRFTVAHEIGHYVLHSNLSSLRDGPTRDAQIKSARRTPIEKEADLFAAELLMPNKALRQLFSRLFGPAVSVTAIDDGIAFGLTEGRLSASQITAPDPLERAKVVARNQSLTSNLIRSLIEIFGVSPTAMGIQLLRLGLVS